MQIRSNRVVGFTIIELLISLAIAALLLAAMTGLVSGVFETRDDTSVRSAATIDARFAMQRMVTAVLGTQRLMLPLADNPNTNWREHVREETVPATAPEGDSMLATAVLAVTLNPTLDIDADGVMDADNDGDGRVDEDTSDDMSNDLESGLAGIDDDGDGSVDESSPDDDDEDGSADDDPVNAMDDDADGAINEDVAHDMNFDGLSGIAGIDDDGDGEIDEAHQHDDDEDDLRDEDWLDAVVFFLNGSTLYERRPNLNPADGNDYAEYPIADNVTHFRVERIPDTGKRAVLVDITLELTLPDSEPVNLNTRVRVGGGL